MMIGIAIGVLVTLVIVMGVVIYFLWRLPRVERNNEATLNEIVNLVKSKRNRIVPDKRSDAELIEYAKNAIKKQQELPNGNNLPIMSSNNRDKFPHGKVGGDLIPYNLSEQEMALLREFNGNKE